MILEEVKKIISKIYKDGIIINGTKEINNVISVFYPHKINLIDEENEISKFYSLNIGNWYSRINLEKNHYKFLESFMIHKLGEVMYFHKEENLTSRKFLIWSQDCIGCIQFLSRPNKNILNIFIRSSDSINLLLSDYLFGCKMLDKILDEFNIGKNISDEITFFTTSSHFYLKDIKLVEKILKK